MAEGPPWWQQLVDRLERFWLWRGYLWLTLTLGRWRSVFVPIGVVAIVAMGVHVASESMVHGAFVTLGGIDRAFENLWSMVLQGVAALGAGDEAWVERKAHIFAEWVDVETRESWARWVGFGIELFVDLFLLRAALGFDLQPSPRHYKRKPHRSLQTWITETRLKVSKFAKRTRRYYGGFTVERVYVPLASTCAVIAGCYAVGLAVENAAFQWLSVSRAPAAVVMAVLGWRLGWPMINHAFDWVREREQMIQAQGWSARRQRLRSLVPAAIIVPVMLGAVLVGTPVGILFGIF
jgi:hypothetical protein